jgi:hypothetical protein
MVGSPTRTISVPHRSVWAKLGKAITKGKAVTTTVIIAADIPVFIALYLFLVLSIPLQAIKRTTSTLSAIASK